MIQVQALQFITCVSWGQFESLSFSFLFYKVGIILVPASQEVVKIQR